VDDNLRGQASDFVHPLYQRHALDQIEIFDLTGTLRDDRQGVRIPFGQLLHTRDGLAFLDQHPGAIRHPETSPFTLLIVDQQDFAIAAHDHRDALAVHDDITVFERNGTVMAGFDAGLLGTALRRAADVEGAHGQLGARLADRLRGDHTHRLTDVDRGAARQIAAVTMAANADR